MTVNKIARQIEKLSQEIQAIEQAKAESQSDTEEQLQWMIMRLKLVLTSMEAQINRPRRKSYLAITNSARTYLKGIISDVETWRSYGVLPGYYKDKSNEES